MRGTMNEEVELHRLVTVEAKTEEHRRHLQAEMTQYVVSVAGLISKFESDAPSRRSLGEDPAGVLASRSSTCPANAVRETADAQDLEHDSMLSVLLGVPYSAERDSWAWDTVFQEKETLRGQAEGEMGREISEADGASDEACDGNDAQSNEEDRFSESSAASVASLIRRHLVVDFNHRQAARFACPAFFPLALRNCPVEAFCSLTPLAFISFNEFQLTAGILATPQRGQGTVALDLSINAFQQQAINVMTRSRHVPAIRR